MSGGDRQTHRHRDGGTDTHTEMEGQTDRHTEMRDRQTDTQRWRDRRTQARSTYYLLANCHTLLPTASPMESPFRWRPLPGGARQALATTKGAQARGPEAPRRTFGDHRFGESSPQEAVTLHADLEKNAPGDAHPRGDASWRRTPTRPRAARGTSGCTCAPGPPSPASSPPAWCSCPAT